MTSRRFLPQTQRHVTLTHVATLDTGLANFNSSKLTVLPSSGTVVFWGRTDAEPAPWLYFFTGGSVAWQRQRKLIRYCEHEGLHILGLMVGGGERLAISCQKCRVIRLFNKETNKASTAFRDEKYCFPARLCRGDPGRVYVMHNVEGPSPVVELNVSTEDFTVVKATQSGVETYYSMCYVPAPHNLIVFTDNPGKRIRAVSMAAGERVWEEKGWVDGEDLNPHDVLYNALYDALFVADGRNKRLLVLNPGDGTLRLSVPLVEHVGVMWGLCIHGNQLLVHHGFSNTTEKVSYFSLQ